MVGYICVRESHEPQHTLALARIVAMELRNRAALGRTHGGGLQRVKKGVFRRSKDRALNE